MSKGIPDGSIQNLEASRVDEVFKQTRYAASIAPKDKTGNVARVSHAAMCFMAGRHEESVELNKEVLRHDPEHPMAGVAACFSQVLTDCTPKDLLDLRKLLYECKRYRGPKRPHANGRDPERPIKVGYVSGDFKQHSAAFIFMNVLLGHSDQIVPYFYSTLNPVRGKDEEEQAKLAEEWREAMMTSDYTDEMIAKPADPTNKVCRILAGDRWRNLMMLSDQEAEDQIRADGIDILVDLSGYTIGGRLPLFTRKPAPVQVTAWGYAHGVGIEEVEYFIADPVAVPLHERKWFTETILDAPCIVTINPYNMCGEGASPPPFEKNGHFTFGSFSRAEKFSDPCVRAVAEIMRRVPGSRMIFKDKSYHPYTIRRIRKLMPGIEPGRLTFLGNTTHPKHLEAMQSVDLVLDSWQHSAGTVGLEIIYMGVPILTKYGTQPSGRTTSSVLTAMANGYEGWITRSVEEYVAKAVALAKDPVFLGSYRTRMRDDLVKSPVVSGYAEAIEKLYREIWRKWCLKK